MRAAMVGVWARRPAPRPASNQASATGSANWMAQESAMTPAMSGRLHQDQKSAHRSADSFQIAATPAIPRSPLPQPQPQASTMQILMTQIKTRTPAPKAGPVPALEPAPAPVQESASSGRKGTVRGDRPALLARQTFGRTLDIECQSPRDQSSISRHHQSRRLPRPTLEASIQKPGIRISISGAPPFFSSISRIGAASSDWPATCQGMRLVIVIACGSAPLLIRNSAASTSISKAAL